MYKFILLQSFALFVDTLRYILIEYFSSGDWVRLQCSIYVHEVFHNIY